MTDLHTNTVEITCVPGSGILTVSAETVAELDRLAATLPDTSLGWEIQVRLPFAVLTARPPHHQENQP